MKVGRVVLSAVVAVAMTFALGATALADVSTAAPDGFRNVKVKAAGFKIAIPEEWETVNLTKADADELFAELREQAPELSAQLPSDVSDLIAQNAVLFAIDPEAEDGFASNLNVLEVPGVSDDPTIDDVRGQFESIADEVEFEETELDGKPAVRTDYVLAVGGSEVRGVQYVVLGPNGGLVFTFTAGNTGDVPEEFETMVESVRIK
jgi:hypothetical protein